MEKFQNRYRIPSARMRGYDYSSEGAYFITICTRDKEHFFGNIKAGEMILNSLGTLATQCWQAIPEHFAHVRLGSFQVMPNHLHGILILDKHAVEKPDPGVSPITEAPQITETPQITDTHGSGVSTGRRNEFWKPGTIGVIVNAYKRAVTIESRKTVPHFGWQSRFHDHIIRTPESFDTITWYILHNAANWEKDCFHNPQHL